MNFPLLISSAKPHLSGLLYGQKNVEYCLSLFNFIMSSNTCQYISFLFNIIPCIPPTPNKYKASAPLMQTPSTLYFLLFIRYQSSDSGSPASGYRYGSGSTAAPLISNWKCRWFPVESPVVPLKPIC